MKKFILVGVTTLLMTGCASMSNYRSETINDVLNTWVGEYEQKLIVKWGVPDKSYNLSDGNRIVSYETFVHPGRYCDKKFLLEKGIITKWGYTNCDLYYSNPKRIAKTVPIPQPTLE